MTEPNADRPDEPDMQIANEFADVRLRKVYTRNGERLEIEAPRRGHRIRLDAVELESLTWQTADTFSGFLRASLGPEGGHDDARPPAEADDEMERARARRDKQAGTPRDDPGDESHGGDQ